MAGELANYATSSSVTSAISSALSSYDDSSQVDSKIITALLDFYTQAEVDQQITNALGNVDLSNYYTQAETQSYVASELLAFYPRSELDSQLTATFLQYWTSSRTQTEIDDAIAGAGFLTQAQADTRYFAVSANGSFESLVRTNVTPPMIKGPSASGAPGSLHHPLGHHARAHLRRLYQGGSGRALPEQQQLRAARRQVLSAQRVGGRGQLLFHLVQEEFTPICSSGRPSPGGRSWATAASSRSRGTAGARPSYPLVATFNSLGSTVTSIDGRSKGGQRRVVDGPQHDGGAPELGGLQEAASRAVTRSASRWTRMSPSMRREP